MSEIGNLHMMLNYMRGVYKVLEEDWQKSAKAIGLTQAEQHIIWIVSFEEEVTVSRIAKVGLWDVSTVMQVIKRLKEKGYVNIFKKEEDRRVSYVQLTERGNEKHKESGNFPFQMYEYIKKAMEDPSKKIFLQQLIDFHSEVNEHFHGKEYVSWIEKTGNSLLNAR